MGVMVLRPQRPAFESYCRSGHGRTIGGVQEEYEKLEMLTKGTVIWRILPTTAEPFTIIFNGGNMRQVILLGFTGGVEYHPIWVLRQFGFSQDAFAEGQMPEIFQLYPLSSTMMMAELARFMPGGIKSTNIATVPSSGCTADYISEVQGAWPISEVPPGGPLFSKAGSSKRERTSSDK